MRDYTQRTSIPLPDAEVVSCYTSARVLSSFNSLSQYPNSIRARALSWALEADTTGRDVLMLIWPDYHFCFAIVHRNFYDIPAMLALPSILAAYRYAMNDQHAHKLFYPLSECIHSTNGER